MDRVTNYYGQVPLETDLLKTGQNAMVGLAKLAEAVLGTGTLVDGLAVTPTTPNGLNIIITPGSIYQLENLEAAVWSSMPADFAHSIVKQGVTLDPLTFGITPPATVGYSQVFLVQVQYQDVDSGATVLPYYNAANPAQPFSGPANAGTAQNTVRKGVVAAQIKAGVAAATGTQTAPTADAGWTGLGTVTVANGATSISSGNINTLASAPYINPKLPAIPAAVQSGKWLYGTDTGTANAMVTVLNPAVTTLVPGMTVRVKKGANPNTTATTLDVGTGANFVKRANGSDLQSGDLPGNTVAEYIWDGAFWQYMNFQGFNATTTNNNTFTVNVPYAADSGTAGHIIASFSPAITSLAAGLLVEVKLLNDLTGATDFKVNALTAAPVKRGDGTDPRAKDGVAGEILLLLFDGTNFQIKGVAKGVRIAHRGFVADTNSHITGSAYPTYAEAFRGTFQPVSAGNVLRIEAEGFCGSFDGSTSAQKRNILYKLQYSTDGGTTWNTVTPDDEGTGVELAGGYSILWETHDQYFCVAEITVPVGAPQVIGRMVFCDNSLPGSSAYIRNSTMTFTEFVGS